MSVSIKSIIKHSSKFSGITLFSKLISAPVSIVVAMVLSPDEYGILAVASLMTTYAALVQLGATITASREIPGLVKSGNIKHVHYIQNLSISIDSLFSILIFGALVIISLSQRDFTLRWVLLVTSIGFIIGRFKGYLEMINFAFQNFTLSAKGRLIRMILYPILTLSLIFWLKIFTIPIVAMLTAIVILIYFLRSNSYNLSLVFNKSESVRLIKIGLVLNVGSILYMLFTTTADQTIIAAFLSKEELGLYFFSYNIVFLILEMFRDYGRVLRPTIWAEAHNALNTQNGFYVLRKMSIYFSLITAFLIGISQLGFIFLVNNITVNFVKAEFVFLIIISYVFWEAIQIFPEMILISPKVDKQKIVLLIWGGCLLVNIGLDLFAIKLGYGIVGVAIATTLAQAISSISMYFFSSKYLFFNKSEFFSFLRKLMLPFIISICITLFHWNYLTRQAFILLYPISLSIQILVWYVFIRFFYKEYFIKFKTLFLMFYYKAIT